MTSSDYIVIIDKVRSGHAHFQNHAFAVVIASALIVLRLIMIFLASKPLLSSSGSVVVSQEVKIQKLQDIIIETSSLSFQLTLASFWRLVGEKNVEIRRETTKQGANIPLTQ